MQIKENAAFIPFNIAGQRTDKACHINIKRDLLRIEINVEPAFD